jgi:hypothetical protein
MFALFAPIRTSLDKGRLTAETQRVTEHPNASVKIRCGGKGQILEGNDDDQLLLLLIRQAN